MSLPNRLAKNAKGKRKGQGLVEFALVLPVLLLMLMGIMDFGWMVFNYAQLYNSMREGLRYGSVPGTGATPQFKDCAGIRSTIANLAGLSGIKAAAPDITITYDSGIPSSMNVDDSQVGTCNASFAVTAPFDDIHNGHRIVIHMDVSVQFLTPFVRALFPGGMRIAFDGARTIFPDGFPTYGP